MKVKIGDKIYDSDEEPIMLILDEYNKKDIADMIEDRSITYCVYPDDMEEEDVIDFMEVDEDMLYNEFEIVEEYIYDD